VTVAGTVLVADAWAVPVIGGVAVTVAVVVLTTVPVTVAVAVGVPTTVPVTVAVPVITTVPVAIGVTVGGTFPGVAVEVGVSSTRDPRDAALPDPLHPATNKGSTNMPNNITNRRDNQLR
jgi:hypothetical protein